MELNLNVNDVSETAFLTLRCHALDALSPKPLLKDTSAVRTLELLRNSLSASGHLLHKNFFENKIRSGLVTHTALRAKKYDSYIRDFLDQFPEAAVINIGCGLDHRFERVDNGKTAFFDLDLPDIMNIKRQIFPEKERYTQISKSVFEFEWMDRIQNDRVILVAEGVFMYCREEDVRSLFFNLQKNLENPEIVFEVFNSKWLNGWRKHMMEVKLKKQLKLGEGASFQFGIPDSNAIERWDKGMILVGDWSYFDSPELDPGILKLMGRLDSFRKLQWTVHYRLNRVR